MTADAKVLHGRSGQSDLTSAEELLTTLSDPMTSLKGCIETLRTRRERLASHELEDLTRATKAALEALPRLIPVRPRGHIVKMIGHALGRVVVAGRIYGERLSDGSPAGDGDDPLAAIAWAIERFETDLAHAIRAAGEMLRLDPVPS